MRIRFEAALAVAMIWITPGCASRSDQEKLQGKWRLQTMIGEFDFGLGSSKAEGPFITFMDGTFAVEYGAGSSEHKKKVNGTFTCDTTQAPKQIIFAFGNRTVVAIYDVSSNSLRICVGSQDSVPPTDFDAGWPRFKTSRPAMLKFKRVSG